MLAWIGRVVGPLGVLLVCFVRDDLNYVGLQGLGDDLLLGVGGCDFSPSVVNVHLRVLREVSVALRKIADEDNFVRDLTTVNIGWILKGQLYLAHEL